jgi:single-strand DNA-binding protein
MKNLKNTVTLIGHVGMTPEIKSFDNGKRMAKFSLATNETYRNAQGEKITDTQWHNVVAWGKSVEFIEKYVQKGAEMVIEGKLMNRTYDDKDGNKKYITEIFMNDSVFVGKKSA